MLLLPLLLNTLITLCWLTTQRIPPILLSFVSSFNVRPPYQFIIKFTSNGMTMAMRMTMMIIIICSMLLLLLFCQQLRTWCFLVYRHTPTHTHTRDNTQHRFSVICALYRSYFVFRFIFSAQRLLHTHTMASIFFYIILFCFVLFSSIFCCRLCCLHTRKSLINCIPIERRLCVMRQNEKETHN